MLDLHKFYADVKRCLKRERASGTYNALHAARAVAALFTSYNADMPLLMHSLADHWFASYIERSACPESEPTDEHIEWLATALSFVAGDMESDQNFCKKDWAVIRDIVSAEAEDLPIDVLSGMMTILVSRKVL